MIGILVLDSVKPCTTWIVFTGSVLLSIVFGRSGYYCLLNTIQMRRCNPPEECQCY